MDPLTAIGLVGNILAFIDFSAKLLKSAKQVHDSSHGTLEGNRSREAVVRDMQRLSAGLLTPEATGLSESDASLGTLARECHDISVQLITLLDRIKPKSPDSRGQSILSALRNQIYEKDRDDLEGRLQTCRSQLELQLNFLARKETRETLEKLIAASKDDVSKLDELYRQVTQLRESVELSSLSSDSRFQLKLLLGTEEDAFRRLAEQRILKSLSFQEIDRREAMVVETHSNTYSWILEHDEAVDKSWTSDQMDHEQGDNIGLGGRKSLADEDKNRAREKLGSWLAAEDTSDIFHLSGKLGSGKSTLMKYISGSSRTAERLQQWANDRKLTIANFYFWNAGSEYEKSLRGLYRGLLQRILKDCPELMATALPRYFEHAMSAPWLTHVTIDIPWSEIKMAFAKIIDSHHLYKSHCFCLFIDGLDEFQTTVQDAYRDLVNLLCRWAANAPANVRICVSSREYPVFMDAFSPKSRIRLHELTRDDMTTYIQDKLAYASKDDGFEGLVLLILNKANGVFLWVALVVKSLGESLENGLSCADLTHDVDVLPDELAALYRHILGSMSNSAKSKAYQTFAMIIKVKKYDNYRMSLLAYSFWEDHERDRNFFMKETGSFSYSSLTGNPGSQRSILTKKKLAGWCKGLVELYDGGFNRVVSDSRANESTSMWEIWDLALDFTHRSVLEFLDSEDMKHDMNVIIDDSKLSDTISSLLIAHILFDNTTTPYNTIETAQALGVLLSMRQDHELDSAPYAYLERFRSLLGADNMIRHLSPGALVQQSCGSLKAFRPMCKFGSDNTAIKAPDPKQSTNDTSEDKCDDSDPVVMLVDPLYFLIWSGSTDYPLWYMSNNVSKLHRNPNQVAMLACCSIWTGFVWTSPRDQSIRVLESMLENRILTVETVIDCKPLTKFTPSHPQHTGCLSGLNIWQLFLIGIVAVSHAGWENAKTEIIGKLLQLFLRWKPDLRISFTLFKDKGLDTTNERKFAYSIGNRHRILRIRLRPSRPFTDDFHIEELWEDSNDSLSGIATGAREDCSLRSFIESCPYDDKECILQMIDEQLGQATPNQVESEKSPDETTSETRSPREDDTEPYTTDNVLKDMESNNGASQEGRRLVTAILESAYFRYGLAALIGAFISTLISYLQRQT